jgi:hypothetical protein
MNRLIVVSGDSHAVPPPEDVAGVRRGRVPRLPARECTRTTSATSSCWACSPTSPPRPLEVIDPEGVWQSGGYLGCWDADRRLAEMDREGVAAELVYSGDPRAISPLSPQFRPLPQDVVAAGVRAYNRWAADAFGAARTGFCWWVTRRARSTSTPCWPNWTGSLSTASPEPTCPGTSTDPICRRRTIPSSIPSGRS